MYSLTKLAGRGDEGNRIEHALKHFRSDKAVLSMLARMAAAHPNSFVPHAVAICEIVKEMTNKYELMCEPNEVDEEDRCFLGIVAGLLPALVPSVDEKNRDDVYGLLTHIADHFRQLLSDEQIPSIWNCLKIAMKNGGLAEEGFYVAFTSILDKSVCDPTKLDSKEENFRLLLLLMEVYFRDDGSCFETNSRETMYLVFRTFYKGKDFVSYLPDVMELVFKMLDLGKEHILSYMDFETARENMLPYLPQLKEKFKTLLVNRLMERGSSSGKNVATEIKQTKFMWFLMGVALDMFDESDDHKVRAGLLSFFSGLDTSEKVEHLPQIMSRLLASLRMSEANIIENIDSIHDEKEQAIKALEPLAWRIEKEFEPFVEASSDAVEAQLNHPKDTIREAAIRASTHFVHLFREMKKIERSQLLAVKLVPQFAKILKTDSASAIATAVLGAYRELLRKSTSISDRKMQLVNEMFNCVNDVMGAKMACQIGADFYDNPKLIKAALEVFGKCGTVMQPFEFAIYFSSILPILCEKLKSAKQTPSEYSVSYEFMIYFDLPFPSNHVKDAKEMQSANSNFFRYLVYKTLNASIRRLGALASSSFETLFPVFLFGMRDECGLARETAVAGLEALLKHSGEMVKDESAAFSREMSNMLAHESCAEILDKACGLIARLLLRRSELVSVEQFLPLLVEKLDNIDLGGRPLLGIFGHPWDDVFKCFQMLLAENNQVLLRLLNSIVLIASKQVRKERIGSIMKFLSECRKRFPDVIDQAML